MVGIQILFLLQIENSKIPAQTVTGHRLFILQIKPLELGDFNPHGELNEDFDYPTDEILATISPPTRKDSNFSCFMAHRIQPTVDNDRWTFC